MVAETGAAESVSLARSRSSMLRTCAQPRAALGLCRCEGSPRCPPTKPPTAVGISHIFTP
eukprot:1982567-Prymnesium_polylepis.1